MRRTHSCHFPSSDTALNTSFCPSGEMTRLSGCLSLNARFCGGTNARRTLRLSAAGRLKYTATKIKPRTPATVQAARSRNGKLFDFRFVATVKQLPDELVGVLTASRANPKSCVELTRCSGLF